MSGTKKHWDRYRLKGAYYRQTVDPEWKELKRCAAEQTPLVLKRQPENRYDSGAIEVLLMGDRVGWVPKESNKQLGLLMDHGNVTVVAHIDPKSDFRNHWIFMDVFVIFNDTQLSEVDKKYQELKKQIENTLKPIELDV